MSSIRRRNPLPTTFIRKSLIVELHGARRHCGRLPRDDPGHAHLGLLWQTHDDGWNPKRIARAWDVLMKRLGYTNYVAQGGDWGAIVVDQMGVQAPKGLLAIPTNMLPLTPLS